MRQRFIRPSRCSRRSLLYVPYNYSSFACRLFRSPRDVPANTAVAFSSHSITKIGRRDSLPSDVPVLRLVQLLKRTIKSSSNIYSSDEKEELKLLLLDIVQHKIYTTTRIRNSKKVDTEEEKEVQKIKEIYTLGKVRSSKNLSTVTRRGSGNPLDRSSSSFGRATLRAEHGARTRGISAPVQFGGKESLSIAQLSIQANVDNYLTELLDEWDFNVFQLDRVSKGRPLTGLSLHLFNDPRYNWDELLQTNEFQFEAYISAIEKNYGNNVYHNKFHATDVAQSVHYFLQVTGLEIKLEPLETFALVFSSIIHDFKHPGVNNAFLIKTGNKLAITYNDQSPLENFHVSSAFLLLSNEKMNFLKKVDKQDCLKIRSMVIDLVLATDLKHHFESVTEFKAEIAARDVTAVKDDGEEGERHYMMAMKMCLKCCDIGHPTKAKPIHLRWSRLIMQEFFAQGAESKAVVSDDRKAMQKKVDAAQFAEEREGSTQVNG